jgi:hypothetical protein
MATSVPAIAWTATGIVIPTEAEILAGAQTDQNAAFGSPLNPAVETPLCLLASSLTAIMAD